MVDTTPSLAELSVAVASDPQEGLAAFNALDVGDPDVAWIVTQNRRKKRRCNVIPSLA
ncbi:hypothetical protein [Actinomyces qiguomingii]|uniref:hypothetical protein n=1 Tax=Actinomyces qiguomingii TaxID=2057800 RepID=UPI0018EAEC86|nr:hypothetical protein [Actinomyces qiguomingii]